MAISLSFSFGRIEGDVICGKDNSGLGASKIG
jgi:hypothetical protein